MAGNGRENRKLEPQLSNEYMTELPSFSAKTYQRIAESLQSAIALNVIQRG